MSYLIPFIVSCVVYFFYKLFTSPRVHSVGRHGYREDILLPHSHPLELYHCGFSSNSQKVRLILIEAGIPFKSNHVYLRTSGSYETRTKEFLTINPAGTVPVLVHNGHPIYESHEQVKYIQENLMPEGKSLTSNDPKTMKEIEYWVEKTAMNIDIGRCQREGEEYLDRELRKNAGNVLPCMTFPWFVAHFILNVSWITIIRSLPAVMVSEEKRYFFLSLMYKIKGIETLKSVKPIYTLAKSARKGLLYHLNELEEALATRKNDGPYLFGTQFTMADVCWVPILDRMEAARWWSEVDQKSFPRVYNYWEEIQKRPSVQMSQSSEEYADFGSKLGRCKAQIDAWKLQHTWFKKIYSG